MSRIYVLHENDDWMPPFRAAFESRGLAYEEWSLAGGRLNLDDVPPDGVFYSRMSGSAHTRGHAHAAAYSAALFAWLEGHGRRVINGTGALRLEVSKAAQHAAQRATGIRTPRSLAVAGRDALVPAARDFGAWPLILKPNRGGKGLGVQRFDTLDALQGYVASDAYTAPVDGLWLLQPYIEPADGSIVRCEFVGGRFYYAVRVETGGAFELCPADACAVDDAFCPTGAQAGPRFAILPDFTHPLLPRYEALLAAHGIDVAGIEFITDAQGHAWTYDINTNTNYNAEAEARTNLSGPGAVADFLTAELARIEAARQHRQAG